MFLALLDFITSLSKPLSEGALLDTGIYGWPAGKAMSLWSKSYAQKRTGCLATLCDANFLNLSEIEQTAVILWRPQRPQMQIRDHVRSCPPTTTTKPT